jgi:hypothetical protein
VVREIIVVAVSRRGRTGGRGRSGHNALQSAQLVVSASEVCAEALAPFIERDWRSVRAHDLDWSVWDTIVHVNDLYFYAAQTLLADEGDYICFELAADDHATPERLLAALAVQARLLTAAVAVADPNSRAHHVYGASDPTGFAAMGAVETLIHTYDAVQGLDKSSTWRPPDDLAIPVLKRLFPHTPPGAANPLANCSCTCAVGFPSATGPARPTGDGTGPYRTPDQPTHPEEAIDAARVRQPHTRAGHLAPTCRDARDHAELSARLTVRFGSGR